MAVTRRMLLRKANVIAKATNQTLAREIAKFMFVKKKISIFFGSTVIQDTSVVLPVQNSCVESRSKSYFFSLVAWGRFFIGFLLAAAIFI